MLCIKARKQPSSTNANFSKLNTVEYRSGQPVFYDCVKNTKGSMKADDKTPRYSRGKGTKAIRVLRVQLLELAK